MTELLYELKVSCGFATYTWYMIYIRWYCYIYMITYMDSLSFIWFDIHIKWQTYSIFCYQSVWEEEIITKLVHKLKVSHGFALCLKHRHARCHPVSELLFVLWWQFGGMPPLLATTIGPPADRWWLPEVITQGSGNGTQYFGIHKLINHYNNRGTT